LEYYSGILFLTTNRVGAIDDAFKSRLHLTLFYPRLDKSKSIKVWKMNIKRIIELSKEREAQGKPAIEINKKRLLHFAAENYDYLQWNGRQIRNGFQTALALAEFEAQGKKSTSPKPNIATEHFRTIALASKEFDKYLVLTHGRTEENQAHYDRVRIEEHKDAGAKVELKMESSSTNSDDDESSSSSSDCSDSSSEVDEEISRTEKSNKKRKSRSRKIAYEMSYKKDKNKKNKGKNKKKQRDEIDSDNGKEKKWRSGGKATEQRIKEETVLGSELESNSSDEE
jgi:hypothetical protein